MDDNTKMILAGCMLAEMPIEWYFMEASTSVKKAYGDFPNVHFLKDGQVTNYEFLNGADLFWYRSADNIEEQGPREVVEAMAAGLPCVVDNRWGLPDRVSDKTGWVCRGNDQFIRVFAEICDDPEMVVAKGKSAREYAKKEFDPSRWIACILNKDVNHG